MKPIRKFVKAICAAIREKPDLFIGQRGSIALEVGNGDVVTLRFGPQQKPIEEVFDSESDLLVWFSDKAFDGFLDGSLEPNDALDTQNLVLGGDIQLIGNLSMLLEPAKSMLALRCG